MSPKAAQLTFVAVGAAHAVFGLVMLFAPGPFYDGLATFEPRNDHFIRDLGTFYVALGVAFAVAAGTLWASYIVMTGRAGRRFPKTDGLALAMTVAALATLPLGIVTSGTAMLDPTVVALGAVVAGLASIVPYTLELRALRRLPTTTFALLMSLHPAVAALAGFVVLHQRLTVPDAAAVALVVAASVGAVRTRG
jgi:inner membrane transporter RhtA